MSHLIRCVLMVDCARVSFHTFDMPELCEKFCYRHVGSYEAFKKAIRKMLHADIAKDVDTPKFVNTGYDAETFAALQKMCSDLPTYHHADIYAFYKAIGWSYVRKKFWKEKEVPDANQ
jgi:hypothetical protein